jgi:hypothetical protein
MVVTSNTGGVSVPNGTTIVSITGNSAVLSNNVTGTGTPTFSAIGPSDTAADGGGIILAGNTQHTFLWSNDNDAWQSSEDMEVAVGKTYNIINGSGNAVEMLSLTQIGPSTGVAGLGAAVTSSVLTSVGTLTALTVSGNVNLTGTGYLQLPSGTDAERPGETGNPAAAEGMLRWNDQSNVFEGYDGNVWGKIGGGAAVQSAAPSNANAGDLWYDEDDGRLFIYYTDSNSSQWVDASPNGLPTDLTLDGTLTVDSTGIFGGKVQSGGDPNDGANVGAKMLQTGVIQAARASGSGTSAVYMGFLQGTATATSRINANGSASFGSGTVELAQNTGIIIDDGAIDLYQATSNAAAIPFKLQSDVGGTKVLKFTIGANGDVLPGADANMDLGSATKRWANIYSADLQLSNEGAANDVDGTWGQYTIQEGEEDLFLINRRSGKKYKFNLTEVN